MAGTRAAAFAPVDRLGLVAIWDDGDDLHAEPRAPYPHAREMLLTRAQLAGAAALVGGYTRTAEAQLLVETGWARAVTADRATLRAARPGGHPDRRRPAARPRPGRRHRPAAQPGLAGRPGGAGRRRAGAGPGAPPRLPAGGGLCALPHPGPLPALRRPAGAAARPAPSRPAAGAPGRPSALRLPRVRWPRGCAPRSSAPGAPPRSWAGPSPGVPVRTSGRDEVLAAVPARPALVVATPGAEPVAEGGYGAVLLLDTWALLTRADLRAGEETLRRWLAAAALARPAAAGRPGGGRRRRRRCPPCRRCCGSIPAGTPSGSWPSAGSSGSRRRSGWPPSPAAPAAVADLLGGAAAAGRRRGARPGAGRRRTRSACWCGCRAASRAGAGRRAARRRRGPQRRARTTDPVRIQLDPLGARCDRRPASPGGPGRPRLAGGRRLAVSAAFDPRRGVAVDCPADPPVRRPGAAHAGRAGRRLRQGAAPARHRPDRHACATQDGHRPGGAADRGGAAGVRLRRGRRGRPPGQPRSSTSPTTRSRTARRAACPSPGSTWTPSGV